MPTIGERVESVAQQYQEALARKLAAEAELNEAANALAYLEGTVITGLLEDAGCDSLRSKSGVEMGMSTKVRGNLKSPKLHAWLREIGNAGLIKSEVVVPFQKNDQASQDFLTELQSRGIAASKTASVPWNSLERLVLERLANGEPVPATELGIQLIQTARVVVPE